MRLQLFVLAYNLGNFLRRLCLSKAINDWSLRSLQVNPIEIGERIVPHARRFVFQMAKVAVSRDLFAATLERITRLSLSPG
ncbi:transposase [Chloroflexota bacterium]